MNKSVIGTYSKLLFLVLVTLALASCNNARRLKNGKPLRNQSAGHILKGYGQNEFNYDWIGMKLAVEFDDGEQKRSFKATLRSKKDSIIWMSISPALGVEVARVLITPDSIQVISKIPGDKFYYAGSIDAISDMMQSDFDFNMIQNALVGNAIGLEQGEDKYKSKIDGQQYVLISKYNRMIKKVVGGIDEKDTQPDDSLEVDIKRNRYERLKRRADEEELLVKRYWFNGVSYRLERSIFDDLYYQRSVQIEHTDFKEYGVQSYPELTRLIINSLGQRQEIEVKINRLKTNKEYDFPFDIPEDFERRTKL